MQRPRGVSPILVALLAIPVTGMLFIALQQAVRVSRGEPSITSALVTTLADMLPNAIRHTATFLVLSVPTPTPLSAGEAAPAFSLSGLEGKPHSLDDYQGKRVVLNFWASWCAPCRTEMPLLEATFKRLENSGVVVIGVNYAEEALPVRQYVGELNITFPILLDVDRFVFDKYGVTGLPTTFFIDSKGKMRAKYIGMLTPEALQQYLDLLATFDRVS